MYNSASPQSNASRVIAFGLRNPFRFDFRPGTSEMWMGDVGWNTWEEIDRLPGPTTTPVRNFGWPCYEGNSQQPGYAGLNMCTALYSDTAAPATAPWYVYNHGSTLGGADTCAAGSSSISAIAFSRAPSYPQAYNGALFFGDYSRNCIWVMSKGTNGLPDPSTVKTFVDNADNPFPVDLETDPISRELFYVNISGSVHRISYSATNQPPVARATATPTSGPSPLTVHFDGSGSSDPNGDALSYAWDLDGNGTFGDSTAVRPSRTYAAGRYTVRLRVTDARGASSVSQPITVASNNTPPVPVIDAPSSSLTWAANDQITFSGHATDTQDGTEPASRFTWRLVLYHCPSNCHTHVIQTWSGVSNGSFGAPDHDYPSYLVLELTVTDSGGLSTTKSLRLNPKTTTLSFTSAPSGLQLVVDGTSQATPFSRTVIVRSSHSLTAPSPQQRNGVPRRFLSWSDGGAQTHNVTAPAQPTTYKANYVPPV
jgi:PKD repeat protein